jgi:hypothetical protein
MEDEAIDIAVKKVRKKCEHGKEKKYCVACGGSSMCIHGKRKTYCKVCGGGSLCIHDKDKSRCKLCKGSQICDHGKDKYNCKLCDGASFCEHEKRKSLCKLCDGAGLCPCGVQKTQCKKCGGASICPHKKQKRYCRDCGGSGYCIHDKMKKNCKICGSISHCEHGKTKSLCKLCGGTGLCPCGKPKSKCKTCHGASICIHGKRKDYCSKCGGKQLCKCCKDTQGNRKYEGYCTRCYIYLFPDNEICRNYKTKERTVVDYILENFPNFTWVADKKIQDGCSKRRPDLILDLGYQVIIIEIDENMHCNYDCTCENKRIMEISQDVGHRPIVMIRFNPDAYVDIDGDKVKSPWNPTENGILSYKKTNQTKTEWKARLKVLKKQIEYWSKPKNKTDKTIEIVQLFYDGFKND